MSHFFLFCCAALLAALAGCSRHDAGKPANPPPQTKARPVAAASKDPYAALMLAVFGADYDAVRGHASADPATDEMPLIMTAHSSQRLPSGETALVVVGHFRRPAGEELLGDAAGAPVNLYLLRQQGSAWTVTRRHEGIAESEGHGHGMELRWVTLGRGIPGLAIERHWLGQGYVGAWLSLFDPASARPADLTGQGIMIKSDNRDTCERACWSGQASWRLVPGAGRYHDLVLFISGEASGASADAEGNDEQAAGELPPARSLAGTARYTFEQASYRLREGENTLPSF